MKKKLALVFSASILAGCANTEHLYSNDGQCITCFNNPFTNEPINHDNRNVGEVSKTDTTVSKQTQGSKKNNPYVEHKVSFKTSINVDVAFIKLKKEFGYLTIEEVRNEWGSMAEYKIKSTDYAYDAVPSAYYHMRARREHDSVKLNIDSYIEKLGPQESQLTLTYWLNDPSIDSNLFGSSLKNRVVSVLNN